MIRLTLLQADGRPFAATPCELTVEGRVYNLTTDPDGRIDVEVPRTAQSGKLKIADLEIPVKIGHLDPIEEPPGLQQRLTNLGYYRGPQSPTDQMELQTAIEEFQYDNNLTVTGECDAATLAKLKEAHGC